MIKPEIKTCARKAYVQSKHNLRGNVLAHDEYKDYVTNFISYALNLEFPEESSNIKPELYEIVNGDYETTYGLKLNYIVTETLI